jgi:succinate-semialdehyde dehydrogenase/glutarate-semialdehyde dehydrogenase
LKIGSGFEDGSLIGPLIDQRSLDKVSRHVKMAKESGAEVLIGGKRVDGDGYFFEPTVLSEVPSGVIDQEETFGQSFRMNISICVCTPVINMTCFYLFRSRCRVI